MQKKKKKKPKTKNSTGIDELELKYDLRK